MLRKILALVLMGPMLTEATFAAKGAKPPQQGQTLKEKVLAIPAGTLVEVKLITKEKLRGRIGELTNEGFSLQVARGNTIEAHQISFSQVKSVKTVEGTGSKVGKGLIYGLAGAGALLVTLIIIAATQVY
ncbi:MAG: hypothetical protein LAP13_26350 [Acidobacteriia bacterium]|nr:hypothetical protein [Terriglobia bacterium]